ncbi:MAG: AAA family ATPase, partial [Myxococcota bacterium]|nr:AAA family ATPase [Myxococcota bacterium]
MHIRRIQLYGFKSFPDKTTFSFEPGLSGVVGPNGCGKSNVVDAVKWCLGEQSAKSMRGASMTDVIFNGSKGRSPAKYAEVSITFARGEKPFAGEYSYFEEIEIMRRLSREGSSEYFINKIRVRLKDIQDIFLDTGLHNKLYSFIEQGQIGDIVNARPSQTRLLFEEAAGISRFKARKEKALENLAKVSSNLREVDAVVQTLEKQLESLNRQVKQAQKYRQLRFQRRNLSLSLLLGKYWTTKEDSLGFVETLEALRHKKEEAEKKVRRQEAFLHQARSALSSLFERFSGLRDRLAKSEKEQAELSTKTDLYGRETAEKRDSLARLEDLNLENLTQQEQLTLKHKDAEKVLVGLFAQRESLKLEVQESLQAVQEAAKQLSGLNSQMEDKKSEQLSMVRVLSKTEANLQSLAVQIQDEKSRIKRLREDERNWEDSHAPIASKKRALKMEQEEQERLRKEKQKVVGSVLEDLGEARIQCEKAAKEFDKNKRAWRDVRTKAQRVRMELDALESLQKKRLGVSSDIKDILQESSVHALLLEEIQVPKELEPILATALGSKLETVLIKDHHSIEGLHTKTQGRVHFLALDRLCELSTDGIFAHIQGSTIGLRALATLIGSHRYCSTLSEGIDIKGEKVLFQNPPSCMERDGLFSIGTPKIDSLVLLERGRKINEKQTELGQIEQEQQRAQKEKESAEQDWNRKQARQQHLQDKRDALQKEVETYDQVIRQKTLEINVLSQQERQLLSLKKRMSEDIQKAEQNIKKKESEQSEHRTRQTQMKKEQIYIDDRIRALQLSIDEERKRLRKYQQSKNEKQTALSVIGERHASAEQNQKNISHSMERLKKRRAELTTEIQRL